MPRPSRLHRDGRQTAPALVSLLLGVLLWACRNEAPDVTTGPPPVPPSATPVVAVRPELRAVVERFLVREATLQPISMARISTRQEGFVRHRAVAEGDLVHAGDLIAELDDTELRLELAELRAGLERAEATLADQQRSAERAERLFAQRVISQEALDERRTALTRARAEVREARARVRRKEESLRELRIVAPMGAVVVARFIENGEYLERGDPVVDLKRVDTIIAVCTVGERDLGDIRLGGPAFVEVTAYPGERFEGLIWKIIPDAQLESRAFPVWVLLPNPQFRLKTGMSARVSFVRKLESALLIPKDAIVSADGQSVVYVVSDDRVERRAIELGHAIEDLWHVRRGLTPDELVVVAGNEDLGPGDRVRLTELPPPGPPDLPESLKAAHGEAQGS
ncbi:MAG: efflux RND transporter periplasmic adaptor subunit [Myxococcota bacterium]